MKITELEIYPIAIQLRKPFKIALGTSYYYEGVLVKIETDENIYGWGEASPSEKITFETQSTVINALQRMKPSVIAKNPIEIEKIMKELDTKINGNSAAKAGIDLALHDILGKYLDLPLYVAFGNDKSEIKTSITIGIKGVDETIEEALKLIDQKVKIIKLKIGIDAEKDIEKVKALREAIGYQTRLRIDANQGYSTRQAIKVLKALERYELEFIEQPVVASDIDGLREVRNNTAIPIMADEALHTPRDAIELIKSDAVDLFNIKLMKSGGLSKALKIAEIAQAAGIPCMVGCMVETKLGITAGMHLALGKKIVRYADLDGHLDLEIDCIKDGVETLEGTNRLGNGVGLGIEVDNEILERIKV
ncbi:MAG: dipeptide epimerase [Candidatus Thermoplasmatota archaeon]|nr:dipeptide epimerase [Candidatus Thermoplasmatota archaeon]